MAAGGGDLHIVTDIFKNLRTVDERGAFIQELLESLPRSHVRDIVAHAGSVDFHIDIVGKLPIEILCLIFHHLDLYQVFQLQRVSKQWQNKLLAPDLLEYLLRPWEVLGKVDLRIPPDTSVHAALALKAEHIDAFKTGNPFSMVLGQWDEPVAASNASSPLKVVYSHGRLAWVDTSLRKLHIKNLEFGNVIQCTTPDRGQIDLLFLTSEIVAVTTTTGKRCAWDCATGAPASPLASVQLSSAWATRLTGVGRTLAIVQELGGAHGLCITIWSLDDCKTRSFDVRNLRSPTYRVNILEQSVIIIERVRGPPDEVFFRRFTYGGDLIAQGTSGLLHRRFRSGCAYFAVLSQQDGEETMRLEMLDSIIPSQEQERKFRSLRGLVTQETCGILRLVFDLSTNSLQKSAISCRKFEIGQSINNYWYCWKTMAFRFCEDAKGKPLSAAIDLQSHTPVPRYTHRLDHGPWTRKGTGWPGQSLPVRRHAAEYDGSLGDRPIWFLGDEIYMIRVYPHGYNVFCFDKNITMADEVAQFRHDRSQLRLERIRRQDKKVHANGISKEDLDQMEAELVQHERHLRAQQAEDNEENEQGKSEDSDEVGH
ncbi:MAG: hypothetical protein Q9209_002768 [Squamulea sp. 1 TL-2023]